jgi:uncharacterized membrane protein
LVTLTPFTVILAVIVVEEPTQIEEGLHIRLTVTGCIVVFKPP